MEITLEAPVITDTVSHYTVLNKLGAGGGGEVCPAGDTALNRKVAIKFLPADCAADQQGRRRLIREARSAVRLHHLNICTICEVGEEAGRSFMVMQYVAGEIQSVLHTAKGLRPEAEDCLNPESGYFESDNPERVATAEATALRLNQLSIDPPRVAAEIRRIRGALPQESAQPTNDTSPPIYRWDADECTGQSVKRTAEL